MGEIFNYLDGHDIDQNHHNVLETAINNQDSNGGGDKDPFPPKKDPIIPGEKKPWVDKREPDRAL